jgi:hypothetical protein
VCVESRGGIKGSEGTGETNGLKNRAVDLQHGSVESLRPCTKATIPSKGFYNVKAHTFFCCTFYNIVSTLIKMASWCNLSKMGRNKFGLAVPLFPADLKAVNEDINKMC